MATEIDYSTLFRPDLPAPAQRWSGFPRYNFIGGHNDSDSIPVDEIIAATTKALQREGTTLATYGLQSGPLGYKPLRDFVVKKLAHRSALKVSADNVLITSGSGQGLNLVNTIFCQPGDVVLVEEFSYGAALTRLRNLGVEPIGIPIDREGMRIKLLANKLRELKGHGIRPKFIYVIPTVQNPGGSIMPEMRRIELLEMSEEYGVPIFEDECYADLLWDSERPPAIAALDDGNRVIHCGSFSKTIAPALRVGYIVAHWELIARMLACKTDGGSGALEQMMLAEYCNAHFDDHLRKLCTVLKRKLDVLEEALDEYFGTTAEFEIPKGGIFLWVTLPDNVDTMELSRIAATQGVALNPGPEWATTADAARSKLRLCFGNPSEQDIRDGVRVLAEICYREYGVPVRSANVQRS